VKGAFSKSATPSGVIGGAGRALLVSVIVCVAIAIAAVAVMMGLATGSWLVGVAVVAPLAGTAGLTVGRRMTRWRVAVERRRLRSRVGDPLALSGEWRRLLIGAWDARDEFARAASGYGSSPLGERLVAHQPVMDAVLERCGTLARCGHRLLAQLRAFRPRRLRRELLIERHRNGNGARAAALQRQLDDVARLRDELDRVRLRLEGQIHDMRTAAWRASTLQSREADAPDTELAELLDDLAHLRAALEDVGRPPRHAAKAS
jgi:hypothetical protein